MRFKRVLIVGLALALACLLSGGFAGVIAQGDTSSLATLIDQRAAANSLPSGDQKISPAEQAIASAISDDVSSFDQSIQNFEQASPANSTWVNSAEQAVQQFNQSVSSDPTAQAISDAVAQYGQTIQTVQAQAPGDPSAQAISDAIEQYGNEPVIDPRGQAISDAVAQYGNNSSSVVDPRAQAISDAVAQYGKQATDPRAQAIADAVAQYGQEIAQTQGKDSLSAADQQRVTETVRESADQYIDQAGVKRPGITKRHINHLVQIMVPNAMLPINGYWHVVPYSMTTSGHCINTYGDNGGMGGTDNQDQGQPLCGYAKEGVLPFIVWQETDIPYLPGSSSIYSQMPREDFQLVRTSGGASTGTVKTTTTMEYEVVAPDEIHVHLLIQEDGGCSMSADYTIKLVTADESVCPPLENVSTPEPMTPEPPVIVQEGPYRVGLPIINDKTQCTATNTPPEFDTVRLIQQDDQSIVVDYGTGKQTLFFEGNGIYEFDTGMDAAIRQDVTLTLKTDGSGTLTWSNNAKDGNICFESRNLTLPGSASSDLTPTPAPEISSGTETSGSETSASAGSIAGDYTVTWTDYPGMACPADLQDKLPKFPEATITGSASAYILSGGGTDYPLTLAGANYTYTNFAADNSATIIALVGGQSNGHLVGSYTFASADGATCMSQIDFAPKS